MSKKTPSSTSAGTANPAPAAAKGGVASSELGVSGQPETRNPKPANSAATRPTGKITAGPAAKPPVAKQAAAAPETEADFEASALALLAEAVTGSETSDTEELSDALTGKPARATRKKVKDETPVEDDNAEETVTGEETAESESTGTPQEEDTESLETEPAAEPATDEPDDEDDDDDDADLDAKAKEKNWPASYLRRIKRERRKTRRLEERLDELEALREENEQLKTKATIEATAPVAVTDAELSISNEIESLRRRSLKIREAIRAANLGGAERVTVHFEGAEPIETSISDAENALDLLADKLSDKKDDLRTQRRSRESLRERFDSAVAERHPWMADRKNPARAKVEEILRRYPALQHIAEARFWVAGAMAFEALRARDAQANGRNGHEQNGKTVPAQPAARPAPPPPRPSARATRPGASPMAVNGQRASLKAAEDKFLETGDHEAGKALLTSILSD